MLASCQAPEHWGYWHTPRQPAWVSVCGQEEQNFPCVLITRATPDCLLLLPYLELHTQDAVGECRGHNGGNLQQAAWRNERELWLRVLTSIWVFPTALGALSPKTLRTGSPLSSLCNSSMTPAVLSGEPLKAQPRWKTEELCLKSVCSSGRNRNSADWMRGQTSNRAVPCLPHCCKASYWPALREASESQDQCVCSLHIQQLPLPLQLHRHLKWAQNSLLSHISLLNQETNYLQRSHFLEDDATLTYAFNIDSH